MTLSDSNILAKPKDQLLHVPARLLACSLLIARSFRFLKGSTCSPIIWGLFFFFGGVHFVSYTLLIVYAISYRNYPTTTNSITIHKYNYNHKLHLAIINMF